MHVVFAKQSTRTTRIVGLGGPWSPRGPAGPTGPTGPGGPCAPVSPLGPFCTGCSRIALFSRVTAAQSDQQRQSNQTSCEHVDDPQPHTGPRSHRSGFHRCSGRLLLINFSLADAFFLAFATGKLQFQLWHDRHGTLRRFNLFVRPFAGAATSLDLHRRSSVGRGLEDRINCSRRRDSCVIANCDRASILAILLPLLFLDLPIEARLGWSSTSDHHGRFMPRRIATLAAIAFSATFLASAASAQHAGGSSGGGKYKEQKADVSAAPKADGKAYKAALKRVPNRPYDPWFGHVS
jgi:hypothetical protein